MRVLVPFFRLPDSQAFNASLDLTYLWLVHRGNEFPAAPEASDSDEAAAQAAAQARLQERARLEEEALPLMLEAMWKANECDIDRTLAAVCKRVLHESTADKAVCRARAEALCAMGKIFARAQRSSSSTTDSLKTAKQKFEDASAMAAAKGAVERHRECS